MEAEMTTETDEDAFRDEEAWNALDYETRLRVAGHLMRKVVEFGRDPGSFRHFIYGVLGFGMDAYVPLYAAGTMDFTNSFDLGTHEAIRRIVEEHRYDSLKQLLDLCDEGGCYQNASSGYPTKDGYRRTCFSHSELDKTV
jgi:hypothetical protein